MKNSIIAFIANYKLRIQSMKLPDQIVQKENQNNISRKEALKKVGKYGKYTALTALTSYMILTPKQAQATSHDC